MQNINIFDYLLLPVYLYIFYVIVRKRSVDYDDADLRKIMLTAFFLRMLGSLAYSLMVQYYYGYGDAFTFYYGSNFLRREVLENFTNINHFFSNAADVKTWFDNEVGDINYSGYFGVVSNLFVMKIAAVVSFLSFNSFLVISGIFGFFSFSGQWRMFKVFNEINNGKQQKLLAWAVLYTPSIWFWGSGLMKDSICIGSLGFIIHYLYKIFVKKQRNLKDIVVLLILLYVVSQIKSYILIILFITFATTAFASFISSIKNILIKAFVILIFLFTTVLIAFVTNFSEQVQELGEEAMVQVDSFQKGYEALQNQEEKSEGGLSPIHRDLSLQGLILQSPMAIFTCLYRPFIWESRKIIILMTSAESLLLLLSTIFVIFKTGVFRSLRLLFLDPYLLFTCVGSLLFALLIGLTTFNFGTMIRYKIILLPLFYFMLVRYYIYATNKEKEDVQILV